VYLCCGDALYDLFMTPPPGSGDVAGKGERASASRIALAGDVGGSPLNVANGLARLGNASGYLTKLSSDLFGQRMRAKLLAEGIDLSACIDTDRNTTLAIIEKNPDGSARYVFYTDGTADASLKVSELPDALPDAVRVLHFGSYSTAIEPTGSALQALAAREADARIVSYDPNLRTMVVPDMDVWRARFDGFARAATLVKASDEDIAALFPDTPDPETRFLAECFERGVEFAFITRGAQGASAFSRGGDEAHGTRVKVDVVDTVGAGDTFQATVLHWLGRHGHVAPAGGAGTGGTRAHVQGRVDLQGCLALALRAAAIVCTRAGADLPTLADLADG